MLYFHIYFFIVSPLLPLLYYTLRHYDIIIITSFDNIYFHLPLIYFFVIIVLFIDVYYYIIFHFYHF